MEPGFIAARPNVGDHGGWPADSPQQGFASEVERTVSETMSEQVERAIRTGPTRESSGGTNFLVNDVLQQKIAKESDGEGGAKAHTKKKGAFGGVFVPTCENMWGVLIFLRFYYIVGQAGIWQTLCVVALSFAAALCTTASMSSIASSGGLVSRGGPYHMISRTLGPVIGASVGIMYWLAVTMLAVLECLGAVEALVMAVPSMEFPGHMQALGSAFMLALAVTVWAGINVVTKLGLVFAMVVFYTLFSYYFGLMTAPHHNKDGGNPYITGISMKTFARNWEPHYDANNNFGTVLALFYPCFTGILSGANRADVLKDPPKSIRRGTFGAVIFSFFMYVSLFVLWGSVADVRYLKGGVNAGGDGGDLDPFAIGRAVVNHIVWNPFPKAAFVGIIVASLSQSLQCLIVAPRLLQQIARDDLLRVLKPLGVLSARGEPQRALLFTYVVAALLLLIGKLDLVAPLLSTCFLVAYGFVNFSCFVLTWLKSPAWRPEWINRKRWRMWYMFTAGSGFALCMTIMFIVNPLWAGIACLIAIALYVYINFNLEAREWGNAMDGIQYRLALNSLIHLEASQHHCVNWRPQVLILYRINLTEELQGIKHHEILRFYSQLRKSRGFCVVACVLEAERRDEHAIRRAGKEKEVIRDIMKEEGIQGFAEVVVAPTWAEGTNYVIQLTGIGGLIPNTVLLDWPDSWAQAPGAVQERLDFVEVLQTALAAGKAVLAVRGLREMPQPSEVVYGTIDIWWMIHDGGFLILLSWLLSQHRTWRSCHLRVFTIAENVSEERAKGAAEMLTRTLRHRQLFDVDVEVILLDDAMIEPYTYDWTLRVEDRQRYLQQLHGARHQETIPFEVDDLFLSSPRQKKAPPSTAVNAQDAMGDVEDRQPEIKVSDCRLESRAGYCLRRGERLPHLDEHNPRSVSSEQTDGSRPSDWRGSIPTPTQTPTTHRVGSTLTRNISGGALGEGPASTPTAMMLEEGRVPTTARGPVFESLELCTKLGQIIYQRSRRAQLVVINLPDVWGTEGEEVHTYMEYCDTLTAGLDRVLFVHSTGREIFDLSA